MSELRVTLLKNPLSHDREEKIVERKTVAELIEENGFDLEACDVLAIDYDHKIEHDHVPSSDHLILRALPKGENGGVGMAIVGGILALGGTALAIFGGPVGAAIGAGLIGAGIGLLAGGIVVATMDVPSLDADAKKQEMAPSIRGSKNRMRRGARIPIILGRHLVTPDIAALPFSSVGSAENQRLHQLFCAGYSEVAVDTSTLKIGDTPFSRYTDASYEIQRGAATENTYYGQRAVDLGVNVELKYDDPVIRTTNTNTRMIVALLSFPKGLGQYDDEGTFQDASVRFTVAFKPVDESTWTFIVNHVVTRRDTEGFRLQYTYLLDNLTSSGANYTPTRQYDVRAQRLSFDSDDPKVVDALYWDILQSRTAKFESGAADTAPILTTARQKLTLIGVRVRATNQLQGTIDSFNFIGNLETKAYTGTGTGPAAWTVQATQNPASAFLYLLQSPRINRKPVPDDRIHWESLETWFTFCSTKGFTCNALFTGDSTIEELLNYVTTSSRASWNLLDNKYTIIIDDARSTVVQAFTPRNSYGFTGSRAFSDRPVTLKMQFVDESTGYVPSERFISYDESTGTIEYDYDRAEIDGGLSQEATLFGVTDSEHAAKIGAYQLACMYLRPEMYVFSVDLEYLIATRGDRVILNHDVPLYGLASGRFTAVDESGGDTIGVSSDELIKYEFGVSYAVTIRRQDGTFSTHDLINPSTGEDTWTQEHEFLTPITGTDLLFRGDLFLFGESGTESRDVIITKISPGENAGTAKLVCVDYSPDIFNADSGTIPTYDPGISQYAETGGTTIGSIQNLLPEVIASFQSSAEALSSAETAVRYADLDNGYTSPSSVALDIIAYWTMNESSGSAINDDSGLGHMGVLTGTVTRVAGVEGNAIYMDQSDNQYAELFGASEASSVLGTGVGDFTIAGWFKSTSTSGGSSARIADRGDADYWAIYIDQSTAHDQTISIGVNGGTPVNVSTVDTSLAIHVALTIHADGSAEAYVNGTEEMTWLAGTVTYTGASVPVHLGKDATTSTGNNARGEWDAWAVWSRALSATEVSYLYNDPDRISSDLLKAFGTPIIPILSGEGQFKACVLRWQAQTNNYGFLRFEIQATQDATFTNWYAPKVDIADPFGELGGVLNWYATMFIHPVPLDATDADNPQPVTTYYRVRQITRDGQTSNWSSIVSVQNTGIANGDIYANAITANLLNAGIATVNTTLTIDSVGIIDGGTDWRAILTENKISVQENLPDAGWVDRASLQRDVSEFGDIGAARSEFVVHPSADVSTKEFGAEASSDIDDYFRFESDFTGQRGVGFTSTHSVIIGTPAKFQTGAGVPKLPLKKNPGALFVTVGTYLRGYFSGWFYYPGAAKLTRSVNALTAGHMPTSIFANEQVLYNSYAYSLSNYRELALENVGPGMFLALSGATDGRTPTITVFGIDVSDMASVDVTNRSQIVFSGRILSNSGFVEKAIVARSPKPDAQYYAVYFRSVPQAMGFGGQWFLVHVPNDWDPATNQASAEIVDSLPDTNLFRDDMAFLNDTDLLISYALSDTEQRFEVKTVTDGEPPTWTHRYGVTISVEASTGDRAFRIIQTAENTALVAWIEYNSVSSAFDLNARIFQWDPTTGDLEWGTTYTLAAGTTGDLFEDIALFMTDYTDRVGVAYAFYDSSGNNASVRIRGVTISADVITEDGTLETEELTAAHSIEHVNQLNVSTIPMNTNNVTSGTIAIILVAPEVSSTNNTPIEIRVTDDGSSLTAIDSTVIDTETSGDIFSGSIDVLTIDDRALIALGHNTTDDTLVVEWIYLEKLDGPSIVLDHDRVLLQTIESNSGGVFEQLEIEPSLAEGWHHLALRLEDLGSYTVRVHWAVDDDSGYRDPLSLGWTGTDTTTFFALVHRDMAIDDVAFDLSDATTIEEATDHFLLNTLYAEFGRGKDIFLVPKVGGNVVIDGGFNTTGQSFDEDWHYVGDSGEPAFQNGWVNYNYDPNDSSTYTPARFRKDAAGNVFLEMMIKDGSVGSTAFTLPEGYRPSNRILAEGIASSNTDSSRIDIFANGDVEPYAGGNSWWAFNGSFNVGDGYPTQGAKGDKGETGAAGLAAPWDDVTTYSEDALVQYEEFLYQSRLGGNLGNQPDISPTWWMPAVFEKLDHFDSGWVQKSNYRGLDEDIVHGLNVDMSKLLWTLSFSPDGTDANAITNTNRDFTGSGNAYGWSLHQKDTDTITLAVTDGGIQFTPTGTSDSDQIQGQGYYYRFQAWTLPEYGLKGDQGEVGPAGPAEFEWDATQTYNSDYITAYGGKLYISLTDGNLNNQPNTSPSAWAEYLQTTIESFTATLSANSSGTTGLVFDQVLSLRGIGYDSTTGEFTAPRDGTYMFAFGGIAGSSNTTARMKLQIDMGSGFADFGPNNQYEASARTGETGEYDHASVTLVTALNAGYKVRVYAFTGTWNDDYTWFSGTEIPPGVQGEKGEVGPAGPAEFEWDVTQTYNSDYITAYGGKLYISLQDTNTGNQPDTSPLWWATYVDTAVLDFQWDTGELYNGSTTSFVTIKTWDPVTLPAHSKIMNYMYTPLRNDGTTWGGCYFQVQYRIDGGTWQTIGDSGYTSVMEESSDSIQTYNNLMFLDFSAQTTDFDIEFRWNARTYNGGELRIGASETDVDTDGADAGTGLNNFAAKQMIYQLNGVKGERGTPGVGVSWDSTTTFTATAIVQHNGIRYEALQESTNVEPGVDTEWQTYWRLAPYTKVVWTDYEPDVAAMEEGTLYLVY